MQGDFPFVFFKNNEYRDTTCHCYMFDVNRIEGGNMDRKL
ncbi:hypothetical protein HMPREF0663_11798 [Hoylesella oralis ATCC 33269]|uniref:Uncharacterized protein n=1 Tax=Hoylesella oralis ATCC 33269 TaxID=873533 RepID=E7RRJ7_9BACT|nr:hypothetical protein HMPREF0663_11798 [Hoylesella oralis ATCC 33269]